MDRVAESAKQHEPNPAIAGRGRAASPAASIPPALELQQLVGNQAMQQLLRSGLLHAKLAISNPDDHEEREADNVASTVMRIPAGVPASTPCSCADGGELCEECERKKPPPPIQRRASPPAAPPNIPRIVSDVLRSSGHPLDSTTRSFFEPRFGRDFGDVRVHTDSDAAISAQSINAQAYTSGSHIAFDVRQYSPDSFSGRSLLAHELVHVAQQTGDHETSVASPEGGARIQRQPEQGTPKAGGDELAALVDKAVRELDKREWHFWYPPVYGDADPKVLQNIYQEAINKDILRLWALTLQQREGHWGNYLNHFYLVLSDNNRDAAEKFYQSITQQGIAIGADTGHFQNLDYIDPRVVAPLNPAIAHLPLALSVDNFKTAIYDLSYKPSKPGQLSTTLRLNYEDGTTVEVSLWDISENREPAPLNAIAQGYVGAGGRVFPIRLSRSTTPRLWLEKQKALATMRADNEDFIFFVSLGLAGIFSNLPVGPVVGPEPPFDVPTSAPRTSCRGGTGPGQGDVSIPQKQVQTHPPETTPAEGAGPEPIPGRQAEIPRTGQRIPGSTDAEHAIDEYLRAEGHDVRPNVLEGQSGAGRQGDRVIDCVPTEYKSISGVKNPDPDTLSAAISRRVMDGRGQARNIIVDAREQPGMTRDIAERGIRRAYGADNATGGKIQSIRVIGRDFTTTVPRTN
jgi:hypothetical protein